MVAFALTVVSLNSGRYCMVWKGKNIYYLGFTGKVGYIMLFLEQAQTFF